MSLYQIDDITLAQWSTTTSSSDAHTLARREFTLHFASFRGKMRFCPPSLRTHGYLLQRNATDFDAFRTMANSVNRNSILTPQIQIVLETNVGVQAYINE